MINRATALAIAVAVAIVAILLLLSQCSALRTAGTKARVDQEQTGALSNSAADAVTTVANSGAREAASEELTRTNEKDIRDAEGADEAVTPAVRDAGLRSLCRRDAYRDSERCRLLAARPR